MSTNQGHQGANIEVFSVSELNRAAKGILENEFPLVFVEGVISNFARPASGHWYFTLKDSKAQLRTAMFRNRNQRVRFNPKNGLQVLIRGKISLYEARGEYQFIAEQMEKNGAGELLVTSMDRDGTQIGYDIELMSKISSKVNIPIIASGGVGNLDHLVDGIKLGNASAVLAASIFHYGKHSVLEAKQYLESKGIPVRI